MEPTVDSGATLRLTAEAVERAREVIRDRLPPTPLRRSFALQTQPAWLKLECWQPTGSFKVRGALHHLRTLPPEVLRRGVVAASAGNHALGVAWAAAVLGGRVQVTLFVPESVPAAKLEKLRTFPVTVHVTGANYEDAHDASRAFADSTGAHYLHAFEDPRTAAAQGSVGLEILEQLPQVARIVIPVGGGGLISSIAVAVKARAPQVRIIAVQPEASPSLSASLALGTPLERYDSAPTLADGVAGGIGRIAWEHRDLIDEVVNVPEAAIEQAIIAMITADQVVAEGSGALPVAAFLCGLLQDDGRPSALVVTGGNIDGRHLKRLFAATDGAPRP